MKKSEVLTIFENNSFLTPDAVRTRLRFRPDRRSFYSYLLRLFRQGLLERRHTAMPRRLVYRLTDRRRARLAYFRLQTPDTF